MKAYQKERIENAICYFAREQHKKTKKYLVQTSLYKYLAFFDFTSLSETGEPALGLHYFAWERGPVPIDIYNNREKYKTDLFEFKKIDQAIYIIPKENKKPDLDYFTPYEIKLLQKLVEIYAASYVDTKIMSDVSHETIMAWRKTYVKGKSNIIDFAKNFPDDIFNKPTKELTFPEEHYLVLRTLEAL